MPYVNQHNALLARLSYLKVITAKTRMKRTARQLHGNTGSALVRKM